MNDIAIARNVHLLGIKMSVSLVQVIMKNDFQCLHYHTKLRASREKGFSGIPSNSSFSAHARSYSKATCLVFG